ncbi:MAG TPA: hypothetical protein VF880_05150, partial [Actinomycetes bacterium]
MPGHVADQRGHGAVRQLQRVVEVGAEQRAPLSGLVAGAQQQRRVAQRQHRQQPVLQPAGELGLGVGLGELVLAPAERPRGQLPLD